MKTSSSQFTALLALLAIAGHVVLGGYENQTAVQKQTQLYDMVLQDNGKSADWPSTLEIVKLFTEDLWVTGEYVSDFFPEGRLKLIHSVGAIAQVKFVWEAGSPYTGLFKAADYGFARMSSAIAPGYSGVFSKQENLTPGMSLKFFRDGHPSANFMAMFQLDGQTDFNFFLNNICNHVADRADLPLKIKALAYAFGKVSKFAGLVGLSDFASFDQNGVQEENPNFPFALVFQANPELTQRFKGTVRYDIPQLFHESFTGNEVLYKVYAVPSPGATDLQYLGELQLVTQFQASAFADSGMFFKHQFIEEDFALRPEWTFDQTDAVTEGVDKYTPMLPAWA